MMVINGNKLSKIVFDMKKLIYSLFMGVSVLLATSCMEIDNFDAPDAHFTGRIIDSTTGENILADQGENTIRIWEKSWSLNPGAQTIPVKQDGTFNNTKLFNGTYDVLAEGAWWPVDTIRVGIGGKVTQNFEVTPYLRLFDLQVVYENDSLTVSCRFDAPVKEGLPRITELRPFLSLTQFCGSGNHIDYYDKIEYQDEFGINRPVYWKQINSTWGNLPKLDDGMSEVYSIRLPVTHGYIYFVRMGARVDDMYKKYNYTEIKTIEIPNE